MHMKRRKKIIERREKKPAKYFRRLWESGSAAQVIFIYQLNQSLEKVKVVKKKKQKDYHGMAYSYIFSATKVIFIYQLNQSLKKDYHCLKEKTEKCI